MSLTRLNRRRFLQFSTAASLLGPWATRPALAQQSAARPIRLGGPVFDPPEDPDQLAQLHRQRGWRAAYCPAVQLSDGRTSETLNRHFGVTTS